MVKFQEVIRQCVTLSTNDSVSDFEKIRNLSKPYQPNSVICLTDRIYIKFKSEKSASDFIKTLNK